MSDIHMKLVVDLSKPEGERESYIPLTEDEIADLEKIRAEEAERRALEEATAAAEAAAKEAAQTKLAALGLTPEEIAAITKQSPKKVTSEITAKTVK